MTIQLMQSIEDLIDNKFHDWKMSTFGFWTKKEVHQTTLQHYQDKLRVFGLIDIDDNYNLTKVPLPHSLRWALQIVFKMVGLLVPLSSSINTNKKSCSLTTRNFDANRKDSYVAWLFPIIAIILNVSYYHCYSILQIFFPRLYILFCGGLGVVGASFIKKLNC